MSRLLVIGSFAWPVLLGAALWLRVTDTPSVVPAIVYAAGSRICHQKPERTFHTSGVPWPVCARCSGLYLAAPFGAIAALWLVRALTARAALTIVAVAALPSAMTWIWEWGSGAMPANAVRAAAALPLGAAVAYLIVRAASGSRVVNQVN
jgi:uncharacterized membrane protein